MDEQWHDCETLRQDLHSRLVNNKVISPTLRKKVRKVAYRYGKTNKAVRRRWGLIKYRWQPKDIFTKHYIIQKGIQARKAIVASQSTRVHLECIDAHNAGWFMVMDTLTIRPGLEDMVLGKDGTAEKNYRRAIVRSIGRRLGLTKRQVEAKTSDYHRCFRVVEEGAVNGKLHVHYLHFMKALPEDCTDPNGRGTLPINEEIAGMKRFWTYGWSSPKACRYSVDDAFSRLNWVWPVKQYEDGLIRPIKAGTMGNVAGYLVNYLHKQPQRTTKWRFRARCSKNLGQHRIIEIAKSMSTKTLEFLVSAPRRMNVPPKTPHWSVLSRCVRRELIRRGNYTDIYLGRDSPIPLSSPDALIRRLARLELNPLSCGDFDRQNWTRVISEFSYASASYSCSSTCH